MRGSICCFCILDMQCLSLALFVILINAPSCSARCYKKAFIYSSLCRHNQDELALPALQQCGYTVCSCDSEVAAAMLGTQLWHGIWYSERMVLHCATRFLCCWNSLVLKYQIQLHVVLWFNSVVFEKYCQNCSFFQAIKKPYRVQVD